MAVIACVDLDPFLTGLVQRVRPDDDIVVVEPDALSSGRTRRFAAVVAGADSDALAGQDGARLAERTVLVAGRHDGRGAADHPGPVVSRPVDVAELRLALARVLPPGRWAGLRQRFRRLAVSMPSGGAIFAVARVAAIAGASGLALTDATAGPPLALVASLFAWALARVWASETTPGLVLVDVVLAAAAILLTAGVASPFLLFAGVVSAEVGYAFPSVVGAVVVGGASAAGLISLSVGMGQGEAAAADLIGWGALIPLSSVVGVLAHRVHIGRERGTLQLLSELHATLDRLSKQAQGVAGMLELSSVVDQVVTRLRDEFDAVGGLLLLGDDEVHEVAGAFGLVGAAPSRVLVPGGVRPLMVVGEQVADLLPVGDTMTARLRAMGVDRGAVVVVVPSGTSTRERQVALSALATEAAVAIDNARLFEGIRDLTVDDERRRLARDLHDGVVQSLVHVRFELDLVRRVLDIPHAKEIERLREVVGQAVDEVRATVNDLRSVRLSAGLGTALTTVAREYDRPGLRVVVDAGPVDALTPEAELQLLRIAQEAISNAVHHGESSVIYVRLWEDPHQVHLQVLDDGVGMETDAIAPSRGVGLRAMQERADLLGAALDLGPGADGGTFVQVDVPVGG